MAPGNVIVETLWARAQRSFHGAGRLNSIGRWQARWFFEVDNLSGEFLGYAVTPQSPPGATRVFVPPWPSKPEGEAPSGAVADLEGVYLDWDIQLPKAEDLYVAYTRTGGLWNFQTNLPFKVSSFGESVYQKHACVAPDIVTYIRTITRQKANIINIGYLGDTSSSRATATASRPPSSR